MRTADTKNNFWDQLISAIHNLLVCCLGFLIQIQAFVILLDGALGSAVYHSFTIFQQHLYICSSTDIMLDYLEMVFGMFKEVHLKVKTENVIPFSLL